eukprot:728129-Rhodomonas_salina.1
MHLGGPPQAPPPDNLAARSRLVTGSTSSQQRAQSCALVPAMTNRLRTELCAGPPHVARCTLCILLGCHWRNGRARTTVGSQICEDSVSVEARARTTRG